MFGGALTGGSAAGVGVATGLYAGICSTITAAQEEGMLTPEQVDQVINRATADATAAAQTAAPESVVGNPDECAAVMDRLKAAN